MGVEHQTFTSGSAAYGPNFYTTGGTLHHDAPSYLERGADRELFDGLLRGEFCYVLTSRQMGKSSLMVRTAAKLREQGVVVVVLDLTAIGQNVTPEQWYHGLLMRVGRQLWAEDELEQFWDAHPKFGPVQRFFDALREVLLSGKDETARILKPDLRLVIFVDEIDVVRSLKFCMDEFFAAIRECYNRRTLDRVFERITFCLLGVATPSDLIRDTRITPFNIGHRIELHDFKPEEAMPLGRFLDQRLAPDQAQTLLERILFWTNGHPYLTQRLCQAVAQSGGSGSEGTLPARVDAACGKLFFTMDARENDDNLIFVRERLFRSDVDRASLLTLYGQVLSRKAVRNDRTNPLVNILQLSGVVRAQGSELAPRNRIYEQVFDAAWIKDNLPDAEARRQREAFRRGVIRTTAIAAVIVIVMSVLALVALNQARRARTALAEAYVSGAKATRVSGVYGQRHVAAAALQKAGRDYTNREVLRDETIACLALADLKEAGSQLVQAGAANAVGPVIFVTADTYGALTIRGLKDGKLLSRLPSRGVPVEQLWTAPGGTLLAAQYRGASEHDFIVWDWEKGRQVFVVKGTTDGVVVDFSSDGRKLAVGYVDGRVVVHSTADGAVLQEWEMWLSTGLPRRPQAIRFNPRGNLIAESCLADAHVGIWDVDAGEKIGPPLFHTAPVYDLSWHPTREVLATACGDSFAYLWNLENGRSKKLAGHESGVRAVAFNRRGTLLATAGVDETIRLWVPAAEKHVTLRIEGESFARLQFSADDDLLSATRSPKTQPHCWEVLADDYLVIQDAATIDGIDFSPDGNVVTTVNRDRATLWACDSGRELSAINLTNAHAAMFSSDSGFLIASTSKGLFRYSVGTRPVRQQFEFDGTQASETEEIGSMGLSRDRTMAALVQHEQILLCQFKGNTNVTVEGIAVGSYYHQVRLHPEGLWIAAAVRGSNAADLWRGFGGNGGRPGGKGGAVTLSTSEYFSFSADGGWFVTCWAGKFHFYRVGEWQEPAFSVTRGRASVQHAPIAFTQDGSVVALASSGNTIQLFLAPTARGRALKLLATLEAPDRSPLEILAFSPDGRRLAAGTQNGALHLWNLAAVRSRLVELKLDAEWPEN